MVERCAYRALDVECGQDDTCRGYKVECPMYTTHGDFNEDSRLVQIQQPILNTYRSGLDRFVQRYPGWGRL